MSVIFSNVRRRRFAKGIAAVGFVLFAAIFVIFFDTVAIRSASLVGALFCSGLIVRLRSGDGLSRVERNEVKIQATLTKSLIFRATLAIFLLISAASICALYFNFGGELPIYLLSVFGFSAVLMALYVRQSQT